ncbi:hypothetical protein VPH35_036858 [Triticum aestivum]
MAPPALNLAGSGRYHAKSTENGSIPAISAWIRPGDEDMTTFDTTKNIAYMHICQIGTPSPLSPGLLPYNASSRNTTAAPCQPRSSRSSPPSHRHCRRLAKKLPQILQEAQVRRAADKDTPPF